MKKIKRLKNGVQGITAERPGLVKGCGHRIGYLMKNFRGGAIHSNANIHCVALRVSGWDGLGVKGLEIENTLTEISWWEPKVWCLEWVKPKAASLTEVHLHNASFHPADLPVTQPCLPISYHRCQGKWSLSPAPPVFTYQHSTSRSSLVQVQR